MAQLTKIAVKNFNADLLSQELNALTLPITGLGWAGFHKLTDRIYEPNATVREVGRSVRQIEGTADVVIDTAQPGELRFTLSRNLVGAEDTALTDALTAHNAAGLSAEQVRQDQDEADWQTLVATSRSQYLTDLQNWDAANTTQKMALAKDMFTILGKLFRVVLRAERGGTVT